MKKQLFFSVGEPSGDQHAARLVSTIEQSGIAIDCRGFGGPAMEKAGAKLDLDLTKHAVVGILEVLPKVRQFYRFADQAEDQFRSGNIDAVLMVDFPGFNWHIAKRAKKYGIPTYYYCPPQLWAWGGWRIRKLKRSVDHVLAVLSIENEYYDRHGVPNTFVGHPFFDAISESALEQETVNSLRNFDSLRNFNAQRNFNSSSSFDKASDVSGNEDVAADEVADSSSNIHSMNSVHLNKNDALNRDVTDSSAPPQLVAVLPGSRHGEVAKNWPIMLSAIRELAARFPSAKFAVAGYREDLLRLCSDALSPADADLPIEFLLGKTSEIIAAADCAMMVSGSVSLEMMARKTPAAVLYRVSRSLHTIARHLVKLDSITLPNLMAGRKIFPELISVGDPQPAVDFLVKSIAAFLGDRFYYRSVIAELDWLADRYASPGATERVVAFLAEKLGAAEIQKTRLPQRHADQTKPSRAA